MSFEKLSITSSRPIMLFRSSGQIMRDLNPTGTLLNKQSSILTISVLQKVASAFHLATTIMVESLLSNSGTDSGLAKTKPHKVMGGKSCKISATEYGCCQR